MPLVFVQRDFGGFDDVRQDAQLLGGAAVQGVRQFGQGAAALARPAVWCYNISGWGARAGRRAADGSGNIKMEE